MTPRRLSPLTVAGTALSTAAALALPAIIALVVLAVLRLWWPLLIVPAAVLLCVGIAAVAAWLHWRFTTFEVTAERFVLHTGILQRSTRTFARNRIRAIDLSAGPVQRLLGLAAVHIGTAEQSGDDGSAVLSPLPWAEALALQAELLPPSDHRSELLGRFEPSWLRYAPLSWIPLVIAAVIYGILGQFVEGFGPQAWEFTTETAAAIGWWPIVAVVVGVPLFIGVIGSILIHTELWWNHRCERTSGVIQVRRGLLTTRTVSLPEERLRGVRLAEPLGIRLVGATQVEALAIGLKNQSTDQKSADLSQSNVLLPYAPRSVAETTAAGVLGVDGPLAGPDGLIAHPRAALHRRLVRVVWVVLSWCAVTVPVCILWWPALWWAMALGAVVLAGLGILLAHDQARSLGHRLTATHLIARSGSLHRTTDALERDAIIGWNIRQSWFQRRRGLMTLEATTGAGDGSALVIDATASSAVGLADATTPTLLTDFLSRPGPGSVGGDARTRR